MPNVEHWIAEFGSFGDPVAPVVTRDPERARLLSEVGWRVEGPFLPACDYQVAERALRRIATSPPATPGQPRDPGHARMVEIAEEALTALGGR